jgi:dATP pyrophosphohydrolase
MVEVCVFRFDGNAPSYLLLKRSETEAMYPGLWQYVTGKSEAGETAIQAALRELLEETGLEPSRFWAVPFVNALYDARHDRIEHLPLFCAEVGSGDEVRLSEEHSTLAWLPLEEAIARLVWPGQRKGLAIVHEYIAGGQQAGDFSIIF